MKNMLNANQTGLNGDESCAFVYYVHLQAYVMSLYQCSDTRDVLPLQQQP